MSTTYEKLEHNMAKLTITVSAEDFEKAIDKAYNKVKGVISIPGFRKGKAPKNIIEKMYGPAIFYEYAAEFAFEDTYEEEARSTELDITSRPKIDVVQIEKGKPFIYTAEVAIKPEVTLGSYDDIEVEKQEVKVTDEDIENSLKAEQEKNARNVEVTDKPAEMGDTVVIDFDGSVDGVPFEGGKSEQYPLTLGSNQFIPGFEEQLVGKSIDEPVDVVVTFPEEYHEESLAGKEAVFKCCIHKISHKELPELNDDFAKDVSEFDTLDEYKADIEKKLKETKENQAKNNKINSAVASLAERSEMDIPEPMIDATLDGMINNQAQALAQQGLPLEQYLKFMNISMDAYREQMKPQALNSIRTRLTLEAVAEKENFEISDERVEEELKKMAEQYGLELDKMKELMGDDMAEQIKEDLKIQDASEFIASKAKEVKPKKEKKETKKKTEADEKEA